MSEPFLSIVTGTYNRLPFLQRMMESALRAFPSTSIPYEFVVVDGGSNDGTLEWLRQRGDVRLIEDGALLGAISAFTRGAQAARGQYVLLANDDIMFHPMSIMFALAYIEDTETCGAVAFADNRPVNGSTDYKVQAQCGELDTGQRVGVTYAQVGLFPKWLGDEVGWWGADDPVMGKARTYGGDNYLSARIWERGLSVDAVPGCRVDDLVPRDNLRQLNYDLEHRAEYSGGKAYHERFGGCPKVAKRPQPVPRDRRLRILYLPIYENHEVQHRNKRGLREALARVGLVCEFDYLAATYPAEMLMDIVTGWKPDLLLAQLHGARPINAAHLARARHRAPGMGVITWNGDAMRDDDPAYEQLLRVVDMHLVVDGNAHARWRGRGIPCAYWQIGYEEPLPGGDFAAQEHDVVFLANAYSPERKALEAMLRASDWNVGLYGKGWAHPDGECLYDFAAGDAIYQRAKIALGDTFPNTRAFVSNRFFQALAAGAFLLQQRIPDFEEFNPGLVEGKHYVAWDDLDDLRDKIGYWLDKRRESRRQKIAAAGREAVQAYSFDAQVKKLFTDILPLLVTEPEEEAEEKPEAEFA